MPTPLYKTNKIYKLATHTQTNPHTSCIHKAILAQSHVYISINIFAHTDIHEHKVHTHKYIFEHTHVTYLWTTIIIYLCTYTFTYAHIHTYIFTHFRILNPHIYVHTYTYKHRQTDIHIYLDTHLLLKNIDTFNTHKLELCVNSTRHSKRSNTYMQLIFRENIVIINSIKIIVVGLGS